MRSEAPSLWASVDPAKSTGIALWRGTELWMTALVSHRVPPSGKPRRKVWGVEVWDVDGPEWTKFDTRAAALHLLLHQVLAVVWEGPPQHAKGYWSAVSLGHSRGMVEGAAVMATDTDSLRPAEWRKVLGMPAQQAGRERLKLAAEGLLKQLVLAGRMPNFALQGNDDVWEAVLIGEAFARKRGWA